MLCNPQNWPWVGSLTLWLHWVTHQIWKYNFGRVLPRMWGRKEGNQASLCWMNIWHHIGYLHPFTKQSLLNFNITVHFINWSICIIQREGGQPLLVWMSIPWKEFQTATKGLILESSMTRQQNVVLWWVLSELVVPIFITW